MYQLCNSFGDVDILIHCYKSIRAYTESISISPELSQICYYNYTSKFYLNPGLLRRSIQPDIVKVHCT
jgi:hypothetical protein